MKLHNKISLIIVIFLFLFIPSNVYAADTVKCKYDATNYNKEKLTTVYVFFNPSNETISKITYINKDNKEKDLGTSTDYSGYSGYPLKSYKDTFYTYITSYKTSETCPDIYVYFNTDNGSYDILGLNTHYEYSNAGYPYSTIKSSKKYTSTNGSTWSDNNSNNNSDEKIENKTLSCKYNFGSDIGSNTNNDHLNLDVTFEKSTKIIIKQNATDKNCGRQGYSYSWDPVNKVCYSTGDTFYNIIFEDPDSAFIKNFKAYTFDAWPSTFALGSSAFSASNELYVNISAKTINGIFNNSECLSKEKLYSYFNPDANNGWEINITTDKKEAEESQENIYNGNSTNPNNPSGGESFGKPPKGDPMTCESLKNTDTYKIVKEIFKWLQIAAPIMLIIFGVLDFSKAVASGDNDAMKKAQSTFVKRIIIVAIIILLPAIMELLFSLLDGALGNDISTCEINK